MAEKFKNILMCSISHELRSPVNHINGILDLIQNHTEDETILDYVSIANSSCEILIHKINDILDYSLLETDTIELKHTEFDIRAMLTGIQKVLNYQFDSRTLNFSVFVSDNVPKRVTYDHNRLKQILMNLCFNAIKYTNKGFVIIIVD